MLKIPDLSPFANYIRAAVGLVFLFLCLTVYGQHLKLNERDAKIETLQIQNKVSSDSIDVLTASLNDVNKQLAEKEKQDKAKQIEISKQLAALSVKDKQNEELEKKLLSRQPTKVCPVPKDLKDAWNSL